jgi:hypothetical protein
VKRTETYPAIRAFARGYLHQDAQAEYGSARAAAAQFCRDADRGQIDQLRTEWSAFRNQHATLPDINQALHQLGSSWQFQTLEEFQQMIAAFK